jgi:hypothetical protein
MKKIRKSSLILSLLFIFFLAISLSLIFEIQTVPHKTPSEIIEIENHRDNLISHGGGDWELKCADCHYQPIDGVCTDCHTPDYWLGVDDGTYFAHHDLSYSGFMDCWSSDCHDPDPNDVRYVITDLVEGDDWHGYCDECHDGRSHTLPE